ncbi:dihydroorotate dehydrogenase electron transfer subunit [candidate division KSB1 bacterium]|nr:dihydroorotate dehydrogenase electron transfer subunit [candidate division KSB1 bacterium]
MASKIVPTQSKGIYDCRVLSNDEVARGIFLMRLHAPEIAARVQPGQFVNVKTQPHEADEIIPLLRRPFSVCQVDRTAGWISVLWKNVGPGTRMLSRHSIDTVLNIIGPLGKGFELPQKDAAVALVAGGLGIAPMPILAAALRERRVNFTLLLGARTAAELWGKEELQRFGAPIKIATDDGSAGQRGFVTELLQNWIKENDPHASRVYSCGPMPMLERVAALCVAANVHAEVAVETVMGCGFGICMGCPIEPRAGVELFGRYYLACLDGPVFCADDIRYEFTSH